MDCLFSSGSAMLEQWSRSSFKEPHLVSHRGPPRTLRPGLHQANPPTWASKELSHPLGNQPELSSCPFPFSLGPEPTPAATLFSVLPKHPAAFAVPKTESLLSSASMWVRNPEPDSYCSLVGSWGFTQPCCHMWCMQSNVWSTCSVT